MFAGQLVQSSFAGLGAFGANGGQQALRGSVVDVVIYVGDSSRVFFYDAALRQSLIDRLNNSGFRVINLDASNLGSFGGGGSIRVRAQITNDGYNSVQDAASVISGAASYLGYNATGFQGVLVSTPQQAQAGTGAGETQTGQTYGAETAPGASGGAAANPLTDFIGNLTKSPTTLAVILGAAVILVIAAKK